MQILNRLSEDYKIHSKQISLAKLFDLLEVTPTPMQDSIIELWDNRLEEFSEVNICASRRQGKTFSSAVVIVKELLTINSSTMVISKSAKSLGVLFNEVLRMLRVLGLKPTSVNSNQYSLKLNDSILRCTVHKTMETLLGNKASLIVADECGVYQYSEDIKLNLLPMRNDYGTYTDTNMFVSKVLKISSPREIGSDFYYDYLKGDIDRPKNYPKTSPYISPKGVCSMTFSIFDSPLASPQLIKSIQETTEGDEWKTEYLAQFIHMNSISAFSQFNEENNAFNLDTLVNQLGNIGLAGSFLDLPNISKAISTGGGTAKLQGFLGLDVGYRDNSAIVVGTVIDNNIYILDTFEQSHMTSKEFAEAVQVMISKWESGILPLDFNEGAIYIDPSAAMVNADLNNTYNIPSMPGYNKIREGISSINTAFKTNKLFINDELTTLIDQIKMLAFKESVVGSVTKNQGDPFVRVKGHHFDTLHAMRYLVVSTMLYWGYATNIEELEF